MISIFRQMIQCLIAEFIATTFLLFAGCMGSWQAIKFADTNFQISFNMALVVMIVVQCFGHISGAHVNPVVTVAAFINNVIKLPMLLVYFIGQFLGAIAGFGLLIAVSMPMPENFCMTLPNEEINSLQTFVVEFVASSMLVTVCCAAWDIPNVKNQDSLPVRLGLTVGCLIFSAVSQAIQIDFYVIKLKIFYILISESTKWRQYESCSFIWSCLMVFEFRLSMDLLDCSNVICHSN